MNSIRQKLELTFRYLERENGGRAAGAGWSDSAVALDFLSHFHRFGRDTEFISIHITIHTERICHGFSSVSADSSLALRRSARPQLLPCSERGKKRRRTGEMRSRSAKAVDATATALVMMAMGVKMKASIIISIHRENYIIPKRADYFRREQFFLSLGLDSVIEIGKVSTDSADARSMKSDFSPGNILRACVKKLSSAHNSRGVNICAIGSYGSKSTDD